MARGRRSIRSRSLPKDYPEELEADVVLRDGTSTHLRPITPHDAPALQEFHRAQSDRSRYMRFFTAKPDLTPEELKRLTTVDYVHDLALIAVLGSSIVGVGRYTGTGPGRADIAFLVADAMQGKGLGTILFDHLAAAARERGIGTFTADVLPENSQMLHVFDAIGYETHSRATEESIAIEVDTSMTARVRAVLEERERAAEASSLALMFSPRSIIIVGASRQRDHVGAQIVRGLVASGYDGAIYPVNPEAYEVNGLKSYGSITDVPPSVDLAVLAVNAERCVAALDTLATRNVKAIIVVSSGFAEAGHEGALLQDRLLTTARRYGMRVLGPASLGLFRTGDHPLNVSLSPRTSERGSIALAGQSTALCAMVLAGADARGLRIREFLSAGNRADISLNDALQRWEKDDSISVIALSLESMGNPRKFTRLVRRISRHKHIVVVRPPNDDDLGAVDRMRAESSLPAHAVDHVLDAAGVIRTHSVDHLLDTVAVLSREGTASGSRVGLLANSPALGAVLRSAAQESGLTVVDENFRVPIVGDDRFVSRAFTAMAGPGGVDSVVIAILDTQLVDLVHLAQELGTLARGAAVQVLIVMVTAEPRLQTVRAALRDDPTLPPVFSTPQRAIEALAAALTPQAHLHTHVHHHPASATDYTPVAESNALARARALIDGLALTDTQELPATHVANLLDAYGIAHQPQPHTGPHAVAVTLRSIEDPALGPVVFFSHAGDATDIFDDVVYAIPPLGPRAARRFIAAPRAHVKLDAVAPEGSAGRAQLVDMVQRLAELADAVPECASITLSPILVDASSISVEVAHIVVGPAVNRPDSLRRILPPFRTGSRSHATS